MEFQQYNIPQRDVSREQGAQPALRNDGAASLQGANIAIANDGGHHWYVGRNSWEVPLHGSYVLPPERSEGPAFAASFKNYLSQYVERECTKGLSARAK